MIIVTAKKTGHVYGLTDTFEIAPTLAFRMNYKLSSELPTSEEGRTAFKIEQQIVAQLMTTLIARNHNENKSMGVVLDNNESFYSFEPELVPYLSSSAYARMSEPNQKKLKDRMKRLLSAVASKEVVLAETPIETDKPIDKANAEVKLWQDKINNLLNVYSSKYILPAMNIDAALTAFDSLNSGADIAAIHKSIVQSFASSYSVEIS